MRDQLYCDDCGDSIPEGRSYAIHHLPVDITSENAGGSATLCEKCYIRISEIVVPQTER